MVGIGLMPMLKEKVKGLSGDLLHGHKIGVKNVVGFWVRQKKSLVVIVGIVINLEL